MIRYSPLLPPLLAAALCLGASPALAQQPASQGQPATGQQTGDPPTTILIPPAEERREITTGDPLRTAPRPEDTATVPLEPVDPGLDGDAPSAEIPVPRFDLMPKGDTDDGTDPEEAGDGAAGAERQADPLPGRPAPGT